MKCFTIYHEGNKIEVFNSIWGKETITLNDEIVSSKYSVFGSEHIFKSTNDSGYYRLDIGFSYNGVCFSLYKDDKVIIESTKRGRWLIILLASFILGFAAVSLISSFMLLVL